VTETLRPEEWLALAQNDLDAAHLLQSGGSGFHAKVCFLAQQCVERSLKGVLVSFSEEPPYIHDLKRLMELVGEAGGTVPADIAEAEFLTPYAAQLRYATREERSPIEPERGLHLAEATLQWAREAVRY